jgi:GT2 family glycosyltransferase
MNQQAANSGNHPAGPGVPDVTVVIVNWNSKDFVRQCLTSVYLHCRKVSLEIIVVDGASFDGCGEMLASEFPSVIFVQSDTNVGFARANNLGVRRATGRNLLFLNPDTKLSGDSVQILKERLESLPQAGAVGCKLLNGDGSLQTTCVQAFPTILNQVANSEYLRTRFPNWSIWRIAPLFANPPRTSVVEVVSGACVMVRRPVFESIGGFTEKYFMYGEDVDLCFKIKQSGHHVYYVPETSLIHFGGGSSSQAKTNFSNVMTRASVYLFLELNRGMASAIAYRATIAMSSIIRLILILLVLPFSRGRLVRHGSGSIRKWFFILRWGLGLESWSSTQG